MSKHGKRDKVHASSHTSEARQMNMGSIPGNVKTPEVRSAFTGTGGPKVG